MQSVSLKTAKVVGTPTPKHWSQVATILDEREEDILKSPLTVIMTIASAKEEDAAYLGKELFQEINKLYQDAKHGAVFETITQILKTTSEVAHKQPIVLEQSTIILLTLVNQTVYVGQLGCGMSYLWREHKLFPLTTAKKQGVVVSGKLSTGDYVICGSQSFFDHVVDQKDVFDGKKTASDIGEELVPQLLALSENADVGGIIISCVAEADETPLSPVSTAPPSQASTPKVDHPLASNPKPEAALTQAEAPKTADTHGHPLFDHPLTGKQVTAQPVQPVAATRVKEAPKLYSLEKLKPKVLIQQTASSTSC
jgi:hypothetical protein